ncbi:glycosyltransferase [Desulfococcus sp.]|uniref:glycosyltransferase n=1 Tax=Desulfococcus sp. TaxID=2025834 RepID=UPI0035947EA5
MTPTPPGFDEALDTLDHFFDRLDSRRWFRDEPPADMAVLRQQVRRALFTILLDGRPRLEAARGLAWPYEALQRNGSFLEDVAARGKSARDRLEALLFLALLPFPGQWRTLLRQASLTDPHPEISSLLAEERRNIDAKLAAKRQKTFKLRHFVQVLKTPRAPGEKGVLRIFSLPYLFFSVPGLLKRISKRYLIYLEPPWGVLARHAWLRVYADIEDPCLIGAGGAEDRGFLDTQPGILSVPLAHGDYLEEDGPGPVDEEKAFDIVFNGLYDDMPRKRHETVLDLLCRPDMADLTALFIGRGAPENVAAFRRMVDARGLTPRVTVMDNLPRRDVPGCLARCRMGIQISLHENVCRSIYEFFRADIPCLVSSAMAGFNFDLITPETGMLAADDALSGAVLHMLDHLDQFTPRQWFFRRSGSMNASRRLNDHIREIFGRLGYPWQEDIVSMGSSGANRYEDPADYRRFLPEFETLLAVFREFPLPVRIEPE